MKLLAFCGRKNSAKDTLGNFLIRNSNEFLGGINVKKYGWAGELKLDLHKKFGVPLDLLYGSDEDKDTLTKVTWGSLPNWTDLLLDVSPMIHDDKGKRIHDVDDLMTIRQLLQIWGTEICRAMNTNVWVESTMSQIEKEAPDLAILIDTRFVNEVEAIKNKGGKVVRLTRNGKVPATHTSEITLDKDRYDWNNFDAVIDNKSISKDAQERIMVGLLETWGWKV